MSQTRDGGGDWVDNDGLDGNLGTGLDIVWNLGTGDDYSVDDFVVDQGFYDEYDSDDDVDSDEGDYATMSEGSGDEIENEIEAGAEMVYQPIDQPGFYVGMTFADAKEARVAINEYGVKFGYQLKFQKNEPTKLNVLCLNDVDCPFKLYLSKDGNRGGLIVKIAVLEHKCFRQFEVPSATQEYLAQYFKDQIFKNPKFAVKDMISEVKKHLRINVSWDKCRRAKKLVLNELKGNYKEQFSYLEAYANGVKESNPGSIFEVELCADELKNGKRVFKRLFVMFDACKKNWLGGCRPLISLDGCFLKSVCQGMLLTAVGKDGNDQIVPIAWAVVNKENKNNWRWFISWLKQELNLGDGSKYTVISDMQKGLLNAVQFILPEAEHRWCARHIYANWSKKWPGNELKKKFWICAWSTFQEEFVSNLTKLGGVNKKAAEDLMRYPSQTWSRAFQSNRCASFMVDNNISESFNSSVLVARYKPIVAMLEDIKNNIMSRIRDRRGGSKSWNGEWSPAAMRMYQDNKERSIGCYVLFNGSTGYEVGEGEDKHTLFLDRHICTCRVWELTGIPCSHAISAMWYSKIDPFIYISKWYHKSSYERTYENVLLPIPGITFLKVSNYEPIEPPPVCKMPGRRKTKRIRASNEPSGSKNTQPKRGQNQVCSNCKNSGHNKLRCPAKGDKVPKNTTNRPSKLKYRRSAQVVGYGRYVELNSGETTINPGIHSHDDPSTKFAIPNERDIIRENIQQASRKKTLRTIQLTRDSSEVRMPGELPFKPPGLQWKGAPSVTARQLLEKRELTKKRKANQGGQDHNHFA